MTATREIEPIEQLERDGEPRAIGYVEPSVKTPEDRATDYAEALVGEAMRDGVVELLERIAALADRRNRIDATFSRRYHDLRPDDRDGRKRLALWVEAELNAIADDASKLAKEAQARVTLAKSRSGYEG